MDREELKKLLSKKRPFEDEDRENREKPAKRRSLPFDDEGEEEWLSKRWKWDDEQERAGEEEANRRTEEDRVEEENTFSKALLVVVEEIAKVYSAKVREGLTFIVEDIEVSEEEKQKLLSAVKDHVKECADPLRHKDVILCLLEKAGIERLLQAYKERNKESVVLLTRLIRL